MSTSFLEAHAEVARERWMRETGQCPDCGLELGDGGHPEDSCGKAPDIAPVCDVCGRRIPVMSELPLCRTCMATAQAHGRAEQARLNWERDGRPD
jgi:hypothetical protein